MGYFALAVDMGSISGQCFGLTQNKMQTEQNTLPIPSAHGEITSTLFAFPHAFFCN